VTDPDDDTPPLLGTVNITAGSTTQCKIFGFVPVGTVVHVVERFAAEDDPATTADESGEFIHNDAPKGVTLTITGGVNTATIKNTAFGLLEVCKARIPDQKGRWTWVDARLVWVKPLPAKQASFSFKIDNGKPFSVKAGQCSQPMEVSVGDHAVSEVLDPNYELDPNAPGMGITVNPSDREVSRSLSNRTVTVSVPYGPKGETAVTFYNRIRLGQVKVCKKVPSTSSDTLGEKYFQFDVYYRDVDGNIIKVTLGPIKPGECTSFTGDIPVLQPDGKKTAIGVVESAANGNNAPYFVDSITLQGTRGLCPAPSTITGPPGPGATTTDPDWDSAICNQFQNPNGAGNPNKPDKAINFYLAPGPNVVTYTNKATDP